MYNFQALFQYPKVLSYLLVSWVHWPPRARALRDSIKFLKDSKPVDQLDQQLRLVDIGCGPGLLLSLAQRESCDYLGIDSDSDSVSYCKQVYRKQEGVEFYLGSCVNSPFSFSRNDVIILNGVVHHLSDEEMAQLIPMLSVCRAVIIADHWRDLKSPSLIPHVLQDLDRGKFVREYGYFENFSGQRPYYSILFPIRIAWVVCWTYFCNIYHAPTLGKQP